MSFQYVVTFNVLADSRLEAIAKATAMLRTDLRLNGVVRAEQGIPGWWDVALHVTEL